MSIVAKIFIAGFIIICSGGAVITAKEEIRIIKDWKSGIDFDAGGSLLMAFWFWVLLIFDVGLGWLLFSF